METIDLANHRELLPLMPFDTVAPLTDDAPRCQRCAAVLVVAHLRCDDGALVPIYRCPVCRHAGVGESSVVSHQSSIELHQVAKHGPLPMPRFSPPRSGVLTDD